MAIFDTKIKKKQNQPQDLFSCMVDFIVLILSNYLRA